MANIKTTANHATTRPVQSVKVSIARVVVRTMVGKVIGATPGGGSERRMVERREGGGATRWCPGEPRHPTPAAPPDHARFPESVILEELVIIRRGIIHLEHAALDQTVRPPVDISDILPVGLEDTTRHDVTLRIS